MADSDLDTASGDCVSCSDTDEVSILTTHKKYQRRVRVSCKLSKGSHWTEAQLKRINDSHQDVWGHDHESVRSEHKCTLAEDNDSFEMQKLMVRMEQMVCITNATGSKIHTRVRGRNSWQSKEACIVAEAIPYTLLPIP